MHQIYTKEIKLGLHTIQGRLDYLQQQIMECGEEGIPENLWCEKCKELLKKINRLRLLPIRVWKQRQSYINYQTPAIDRPLFSNPPEYMCADCYQTYYSLNDKGIISENNEHKCSCGGRLLKLTQ
jgi:DNA-directed RNA polymerase subunit RPC12/RpoP